MRRYRLKLQVDKYAIKWRTGRQCRAKAAQLGKAGRYNHGLRNSHGGNAQSNLITAERETRLLLSCGDTVT